MKFQYLYLVFAGALIMSACSDDVTSPVLELRQPAVLNEIAGNEIVINKDNATRNFPEITWYKADYGNGAVVNYTAVLTNVTTGKQCVIGETGDTGLTLTNADMNTMFAKLGAYPGQMNEYRLSLKSQAFDAFYDDATNTVSFKAAAYDPNVDDIDWDYAYVAVNYPDWDFTTAYIIGDPDNVGCYKGWVKIDENVSYAIVKGDDVNQVLATGEVDDNNKGFFEIVLSADGTLTHSVACNTWGLIGDATSGGWNDDTEMEYDDDTRLWSVITPLTANHFKFRANKDWTINYGIDETVPGILVASGADIGVDVESPYIVTMDLTHGGKYTFTMEETTIELSSAFMTLPGSYQGWSPEADNCYKVYSDSRDFKYTGAYYFEAATEFKFYDAGSWIGIVGDVQWNDAATAGTFVIGDGDNIVITESAFYKISADTRKMIASLSKTGWEIIGDATPGGWDSGQLMDYDPETNTWNITIELADGDIKFRWDASWTVNLGGDLQSLTQDGANIHVNAGTYDIILDADNYKATITSK